MSTFDRSIRTLRVAGLLLSLPALVVAATPSSIQGTVHDSLGAIVPNAKVDLLDIDQAKDHVASSAVTDASGAYRITVPIPGRYRLRVSAASFSGFVSDSISITANQSVQQDAILGNGTRTEQITVTTTGTPVPLAQTGAAVTVLTPAQLDQHPEIQQSLRLVPGLQLVQTGQPGGTTSLFVRGGNGDATKVLIDGIPANDLGGFTELANIAATGIDRAEVLRAPNSALYGSDALAGVVTLTSSHGVTPLPLLTYSVNGGNFGTYRQEGSLAGAWKQFDYFSAYSRFDTANSIPHSQFHNGTYAGNFGWNLGPDTSARVTVRHLNTVAGNANAFLLYGIPDDAAQKEQDTYIGATVENEHHDRWHNLVRYGALRLRGQFYDYAPTGIPYDPFDTGSPSAYLGKPVTLHGANGYTVSGQAIFQFPGTYPSSYITPSSRDFVYAQSDYRFTPHIVGLAGFQYEDERASATSSGAPAQSVERSNYSYRMQINGDLRNRLYYTVGSSIEKNQVFGVETTPRLSLAYYLFRPQQQGLLSGTKLRASFGKGVLEPSLANQLGSLFGVLAGLPNGQQLAAQNHVNPVGAQRSRSYDGGVDQLLFNGRAKLGLTYFHNEFGNQIEFVAAQALLQLGVPADVESQIANTAGGAYVNSQDFRAQGVELEGEYQITHRLFARGGYTYLDAVIQRSFTGDALAPSINPAFPNLPIGAFSPLIGARPFRRAPHTGYFQVSYEQRRWSAALSGTLVGKRDDSDFLSDANFGTTLLLPNRNLDAGYQRIDLHASYQATRTIALESTLGNLLSQQTGEAFGYPSLPFTFRSGVKLTWGGESWKWR
ncbi:MAG: vitamin transporter [Acidobacteriaceae bacterium]|nr:vitamin transporter [Acidobacteriaceae bacterium]